MEKVFNKQVDQHSGQTIFANQLITVQDLFRFKNQFLEELLTALKNYSVTPAKKWLKAHEVRRLLKISPGTLQTLKANGTIPYTKIGGVHFFDYEDCAGIRQNKSFLSNTIFENYPGG